MRDLSERFTDGLDRSGLVAPGQHVCVALSGGCDSVVLLRLLVELRGPMDLRVSAAHFDHRMRADSGADCAWVAGLCRAWQVPLVAASALEPLRSEAAARRARYAFLRDARRALGADRLATAHHADDQAETVLLRLARGTGARGLRAIAPRRGRLVRPLLDVRRQEIEAFARGRALAYRADPTNGDERFLRNRIRRSLLPALEGVASARRRARGAEGTSAPASLTGALARTATDARAVERRWRGRLDAIEAECVERRTPTGYVVARSRLLGYPAAARARLLRRLLRRLGAPLDRAGTEAALAFISTGSSGGGIDVGGGVRVERHFDRIRVARTQPGGRSAPDDAPRMIALTGSYGRSRLRVGERLYDVEWRPGRGDAAEPETTELLSVAPAALGDGLIVRGWRPGDAMRLHGGSKKLKKLFNEKRVERPERHRLPLVADARGRVLWVPGVARAPLASRDRTGARLTIRVTHAEFG